MLLPFEVEVVGKSGEAAISDYTLGNSIANSQEFLLQLFTTGYFTQISTLADVQENVMEYLHVLSRPKVIDREHDTVWTEAYIDSTVSCWTHYQHFYAVHRLCFFVFFKWALPFLLSIAKKCWSNTQFVCVTTCECDLFRWNWNKDYIPTIVISDFETLLHRQTVSVLDHPFLFYY